MEIGRGELERIVTVVLIPCPVFGLSVLGERGTLGFVEGRERFFIKLVSSTHFFDKISPRTLLTCGLRFNLWITF